MMVNGYDAAHFLLVLQTDHCHLAGYLAAHWGNAVFAEPKPYASVVVAAQEHDCGWWNWEIKPGLNQDDCPIDYQHFWMGTTGVAKNSEERGRAWLGFYKDGIDRVAQQDSYAGLVVLMHGTGLLSQGFGVRTNLPDMRTDPLAGEFLADRERLRLKLLGELRGSQEYREVSSDEHLWVNFKLLEVYDQLSQFICNRYPFNNTERVTGPRNVIGNAPVGPGREDTSLRIEVLDEKRAVIDPYPFDVSPLEVSYPARVVGRRPYASQDEFLREYYKAAPITVSYTLHAA